MSFPLNDEIRTEGLRDGEVVDHNGDALLRLDPQTSLAQSRRQHLLVNRLQQPGPQFGMQPESLIKHPLGQNVLLLHSVASLANVA